MKAVKCNWMVLLNTNAPSMMRLTGKLKQIRSGMTDSIKEDRMIVRVVNDLEENYQKKNYQKNY